MLSWLSGPDSLHLKCRIYTIWPNMFLFTTINSLHCLCRKLLRRIWSVFLKTPICKYTFIIIFYESFLILSNMYSLAAQSMLGVSPSCLVMFNWQEEFEAKPLTNYGLLCQLMVIIAAHSLALPNISFITITLPIYKHYISWSNIISFLEIQSLKNCGYKAHSDWSNKQTYIARQDASTDAFEYVQCMNHTLYDTVCIFRLYSSLPIGPTASNVKALQ